MAGTSTNAGAPLNVADQLRRLVARGVLAPGMRLGQTELARQFKTSRVPVREALKLLTSEAIVEHDPNRGFFVARLSSDEARQLFRMRHLIEDELLSTIVLPKLGQLAMLGRAAAELAGLLDVGDRSGWWVKHRAFHQAIFDLSPDKVILREAMRLWTLTDRYRALLPLPRRSSVERSVVDMQSLVDALRRGDRAAVMRVRRERREAFETLVLEMLEDRNL